MIKSYPHTKFSSFYITAPSSTYSLLRIASVGWAFLFFCTAGISQSVDSTEYKQFKRMLPFIIKSIAAGDQTASNEMERVEKKEFVAPWKMDQFDESQIKEFVQKLQADSKYELKEARRGDNMNLNIYATLQNFRDEPELKEEFKNIIIEISNFKILNEKGEDIYLEGNKNALQPKLDGRQQIKMQGAQFNCLIPVSKNYANVNGSIDLTIQEKSDFVFQELSKSDEATSFDFNGTSMELIKIEGNKAFLRSDGKVDNLKMLSVNGENRKHNQTSVLSIPEKIYLKAQEENLSEEGITAFVDEYSMEDFNSQKNEATIMVFQSSGNIGKLYLYQITKMMERGKCTLNFSL